MQLLKDKNINFNISATSRSSIKFSEKKIKSYLLNNNNFDPMIKNDLKDSTHILISTPPEIETIIIENFLTDLKSNLNLQWVGYLSSTSVYGDHKGNWVDETSNTNPTSEMGLKRLEAEKRLLNSNLPIRIFRLAGIYSLERNIFSRLRNNKIEIVNMKNQIFSRIHVEDIAQVLLASFFKSADRNIFNVSDDEPCSYKEVVEYATSLLKIKMPDEVMFEDMQEGKMKNFYKDKKKISNKKMKLLGVRLKYPTYKKGLDAIFDQIR